MTTRLFRLAFVTALVVIFVLSLMPVPEGLMVFSWQDKVEHVLAFFGLGLLGLASRLGRPVVTMTGLLAYGGLIELAQGMTSYRMADPADFFADAIGVALATVTIRVWMQRTI